MIELIFITQRRWGLGVQNVAEAMRKTVEGPGRVFSRFLKKIQSPNLLSICQDLLTFVLKDAIAIIMHLKEINKNNL